MLELKFKSELDGKKKAASCCECGGTALYPAPGKDTPEWVIGSVMTPAGPVPNISCTLSRIDCWEHFKCRTTAYRDDYRVVPGLYAVGSPDNNSDVLVSANYKYSFDMLRRELKDLNAWVLVLDTKGINVWCAAGKGTFGQRRTGKADFRRTVEQGSGAQTCYRPAAWSSWCQCIQSKAVCRFSCSVRACPGKRYTCLHQGRI